MMLLAMLPKQHSAIIYGPESFFFSDFSHKEIIVNKPQCFVFKFKGSLFEPLGVYLTVHVTRY